ncbi:MAG: HEAT repeat domain-containing protein, partial [Gammaproteobacteria bacterium]|nr:HEAT repeat domain-containing protein [Gammaproteobacteria bacterium]
EVMPLIDDLVKNQDFHVARFARFISDYANNLAGAHIDNPQNDDLQQKELNQTDQPTTISRNYSSISDDINYKNNSFSLLSEEVLNNSNPEQRVQALNEATKQDGDELRLLLQQTISDPDQDIRLATVNGIVKLLENDTDDAQQLLSMLQQSAYDTNQTIAQFATKALERFSNKH